VGACWAFSCGGGDSGFGSLGKGEVALRPEFEGRSRL